MAVDGDGAVVSAAGESGGSISRQGNPNKNVLEMMATYSQQESGGDYIAKRFLLAVIR